MTRRLELAFRSLERMRRFRGHFYNWYDLRDLQRAGAGVRLHGGQRQPRRPPHRAAAGLPGADRRAGARRAGLARARRPRSRWRDERLRTLPRRGQPAARAPARRPRGAGAGAARAGLGARRSRAVAEPLASARGRARRRRRSRPRCGAARRSGSPGASALIAAAQRELGRRARATAPADRCAQLAADLGRRRRAWSRGSRRIADRAYDYAMEMDFRFLFDSERKLFAIGYQQATPHARRLVLRPARLRGAAGELHRHRQERRAGRALVPAGPHADPRRGRRRRWCRGAAACSST